MKNYKKIVVEKIFDNRVVLEITLLSSRSIMFIVDRSKIIGDVKESDLLEITDGKFRVLEKETEEEKNRIQEKLNRLFNK